MKENLWHKIFAIFFKRRQKTAIMVFLFAFIGIFVFVFPAYATMSAVVQSVIGWIVEQFVWVIGQAISLFTYVLVAVANYNSFSTSPAVTTGWVIVRDIANMFFVIIFLVIAFGTILGIQSYHYSKTLPRLLLMAILINFSKTIAGLAIDVSQVIMMTFVNGFSQAAGGNFLELLKIREMRELRTMPMPGEGEGEGEVINLANTVGALILSAILALVALVVMVVITMVLVMRIVTLWLLVVISPLAFFAYAVPGGSISGKYNEWWRRFTSELIVGPVLAFFLWLSLAVVGRGELQGVATDIADNAKSEGQTGILGSASSTTSASALPSGIASESNMIQYIIGIGMLIGGLAMAQSAGAAGSKYAGMGMGFVQKSLPGYAKTAGKWMGKKTYAPVKKRVVRPAGEWAYGKMARSGIPILSGIGAKRVGALRSARIKEEEVAAAHVRGMSPDEKLGRLKALKMVGHARNADQEAEFAQLQRGVLKDLRFKDATPENKALAQDATNYLMGDKEKKKKGWAEIPGHEEVFKETIDFQNTRPDMVLSGKKLDERVSQMSIIDLRKINAKSKASTEFLEALHKDPNRWGEFYTKEGIEQRQAMDAYEATSAGIIDLNAIKPAERANTIKSMSLDKVEKISKESITKEDVRVMSPQQVEVLLKMDKIKAEIITPEVLKSDNFGTMAGKIAEHGSESLKKAMQRNMSKEYIAELTKYKNSNYAATPTGYTPPIMEASKEILMSGGGLQNSYNVKVDGNFGVDFRGQEDRKSFQKSLSDDPKLALNIKPEEIKGQVEQVVQTETALYKSDALRKLAESAKTDEQKDTLEVIIESIMDKAIKTSDRNMIEFIARNSGIRGYVSEEQRKEGRKILGGPTLKGYEK